MVLTHNEIVDAVSARQIVIKPYYLAHVGPNSYDIHLSDVLLEAKQGVTFSPLETNDDKFIKHVIDPNVGLVLNPGTFYLATTMEYTETLNHVPVLHGRSSIGRMGLFVHVTAGFGDIGFKGIWTLELKAILPFKVYPGMPIGQLEFQMVSESNHETMYGSNDLNYNNIDHTPGISNMVKKPYWKDFYKVN